MPEQYAAINIPGTLSDIMITEYDVVGLRDSSLLEETTEVITLSRSNFGAKLKSKLTNYMALVNNIRAIRGG